MSKCKDTNAQGQKCPFESRPGSPYCGHHSPKEIATRQSSRAWRTRNKGGRPLGYRPEPKEGRRPNRVVIMLTDTELEALEDQRGERTRGLAAYEIFKAALWG